MDSELELRYTQMDIAIEGNVEPIRISIQAIAALCSYIIICKRISHVAMLVGSWPW